MTTIDNFRRLSGVRPQPAPAYGPPQWQDGGQWGQPRGGVNSIIESQRVHTNHSFLNTLHSLQSKSTCELMLEPTTFGAVGQWPPTLPICYAIQLKSLVKAPIPDPHNQIKDPHI